MPKDNKRTIFSWALYDWANSSFTTLVVTFIYGTYFTKTFVESEVVGTVLWSRAIGLSALLVAALSPFLGAMADKGIGRRKALVWATGICVSFTTVLAFIAPGVGAEWLIALGVFVIANVAFEVGQVFYNAFLPDIVSPKRVGRVSGFGWGLGYLGGLTCMALGLFAFVGFAGADPWLPLSKEAGFNVRATNLLVAAWFFLFSLPLLLGVEDPDSPKGSVNVKEVWAGLMQTFGKVKHYGQMVRFLIARLIYNDALITIFALGGIYAAGTFGWELSKVLMFGIAINATAGLGAFVFGVMDDKLGGKKTILLSVLALIAATFTAMVAPTDGWFWAASVGIGIFAGPNQSASRSLMARFVPDKHEAEFFGFFAFSGKFTAFMGPMLFGYLTGMFDSQRAGVGAVLVLFLVGAVVLVSVDEAKGIREASMV
ncbi:MAG: MFS transporter [Gemmatimonadota bacterium]|nr:MFS transporter [Gemmatimonadota bacterium]